MPTLLKVLLTSLLLLGAWRTNPLVPTRPRDALPVATGGVSSSGWTQSYKAGYVDVNGKFAGGSEIMHIKAHKGKLYAINGYWEDSHYPQQSAQVLRLDSPSGQWVVDLDTGHEAPPHIKGNILASVHLSTDIHARAIDETLLIAGSQAASSPVGGTALSVFIRNDTSGTWSRTVLLAGPEGGRRVPRNIKVHRDTVTGVDLVFMLCGDSGIISGAFDAAQGELVWKSRPEFPVVGAFQVRALGLASANGKLYFSDGGQLFERTDGPQPNWSLAFELPGKVNTEVGGIRGLTTINNPAGLGDSLIFVWAPDGHSEGTIMRLDGQALLVRNETSLKTLFYNCRAQAGQWSFSLGGYNQFFTVRSPLSNATLHVIGFETRLLSADPQLTWNSYYAGACYAVRDVSQQYTVHEVNGKYNPRKPVLEAPRAFSLSPFAGESEVLYIGGFDANFFNATSRAWIFKADLQTIVGVPRQGPRTQAQQQPVLFT